MKGKVNILVLAMAIVAFAMFGASGFLLYRGISKFSASEKKAGRLLKEITRYYNRSKPFPIPPNVEKKQENADKLDEWYEGLTEAFRKGEVSAVERSPSKFIRLLTTTQNALDAKAEDIARDEHRNRPIVKGFSFGFDEYLAEGSMLPKPDIVPDLSRDLVVVYEVCRILMNNNAASIDAIYRGDPPKERRKPRRPRPGQQQKPQPDDSVAEKREEDQLYSMRKFTFEFSCKEHTLLEVLNAISRNRIYMEVSSVELSRSAADIIEPQKPGRDEEESAAESDKPDISLLIGPQARHEARMMSGPGVETPMRVSIEIHVYRFRREAADEES